MKIQHTTVTPLEGDKTRIEMQVSTAPEVENSAGWVLLSVEIPKAVDGKRLEWLQHRALDQVLESLGVIEQGLARALQP